MSTVSLVSRQCVAAVAVLLTFACNSRDPDPPPSSAAVNPEVVDEVIAAERAFSAMSDQAGVKAAFQTFYATDGIAFDPAPTNGQDLVAGWSDDGPHMVWGPDIAEASAAGDMGYTSGPYVVTLPDGSHRYGHYHSVWARQADGAWRVVIDVGGPHGVDSIPAKVERPAAPSPPSSAAGGDTDLLAVDRAFAEAYARERWEATRRFTFDRARVYRFGQLPFRGLEAALEDQERSGEVLTWEPEGARVARSDDLGFTYGNGTVTRREAGETPQSMSYGRFWRRGNDGAWRVVVEVVLPHPPAETS